MSICALITVKAAPGVDLLLLISEMNRDTAAQLAGGRIMWMSQESVLFGQTQHGSFAFHNYFTKGCCSKIMLLEEH